MIRFHNFIPLVFVITVSFASFASAQDQLDLSLPGEEKTVEVTTGKATEGEAAASAERGKKTLLDRVKEGGWAMIPIIVMLFAVLFLSVYFLLDLRRNTFLPASLIEQLEQSAKTGDLPSLALTARENPSCLGQVMNGACEYIYDRGYQVLDGDSIYDLMAEASQEFNRRRVSLLNYLSVIAQASPMVGLLGTVSGMIKAFSTLEAAGMGNPDQLAGNISEALITTAAGLIVALPAIFAFFFFRDRITALVAGVDKECSRLLNFLRRAVLSGTQPPPPESHQSPAHPHPLA